MKAATSRPPKPKSTRSVIWLAAISSPSCQKNPKSKPSSKKCSWNGLERLGSYTLADVTPALIVKCRDELADGTTYRNTQRSPTTVVRYLSALSHCYSIAVTEWGWLEESPMRKVKKPRESRGRVRFLDDGERARLLDACKESSNPLLYPCVVLALSTGMRYSELMGLRWQATA